MNFHVGYKRPYWSQSGYPYDPMEFPHTQIDNMAGAVSSDVAVCTYVAIVSTTLDLERECHQYHFHPPHWSRQNAPTQVQH